MMQAMILNLAVLTKELRTRMRGRRTAVVVTVYLLLLARAPHRRRSSLGGLTLYIQLEQFRSGFNPGAAPAVGFQLFSTLSLFQLFLVIFIVPGLTGAAIAGERDRQTLDLLLSTQVSALWIVLGKILASLSYVFLLMVAALPLFSLVFLFGGVSPGQVGLAFVISLVSALTLGTIGIFLSVLNVLIRGGPTATVLAYAVTFILLIGTPLLSIFIGMASDSSAGFPVQVSLPLVLNPLAALASATPGSFIPDLPLMGTSRSGTSGGLVLWHISLIVDGVLILVFLSLAATMLRPGTPRFVRLRRPRLAGRQR